ncbi:MAG: hypothetical protein H6622_05845 [Halobacteriovoraceae bacterium]|nr:hypothetical protein [Halobacteriovoraceae bacterium]
MKLSQALEEKILDVRLRDRLLSEGTLSQAELQKYIESMPDDSRNVYKDRRDEE